MTKCETCGSTSARTLDISVNGVSHSYDSLECAIFALAPRCANCSELVVSRGIAAKELIFCGDSCARVHAMTEAFDWVGSS